MSIKWEEVPSEMWVQVQGNTLFRQAQAAEIAAYEKYRAAVEDKVDEAAGADILISEGDDEGASAKYAEASAAEEAAYREYDAAVARTKAVVVDMVTHSGHPINEVEG